MPNDFCSQAVSEVVLPSCRVVFFFFFALQKTHFFLALCWTCLPCTAGLLGDVVTCMGMISLMVLGRGGSRYLANRFIYIGLISAMVR